MHHVDRNYFGQMKLLVLKIGTDIQNAPVWSEHSRTIHCVVFHVLFNKWLMWAGRWTRRSYGKIYKWKIFRQRFENKDSFCKELRRTLNNIVQDQRWWIELERCKRGANHLWFATFSSLSSSMQNNVPCSEDLNRVRVTLNRLSIVYGRACKLDSRIPVFRNQIELRKKRINHI